MHYLCTISIAEEDVLHVVEGDFDLSQDPECPTCGKCCTLEYISEETYGTLQQYAEQTRWELEKGGH